MDQINTKTLALTRALSQTIASSGLPPCVAGLVLDRLRAQMTTLEAQAIQREQQAAQEPEGPEEG